MYSVLETPIGPLTVVSDGEAVIGIYMANHAHAPDGGSFGDRDDVALAAAIEQLTAYFAGDRTTFDLPVKLHGTPFQQRVWAELRQIEYGQTISYGELARRLGQPTASRAVGLANGRNPVSIVVPCHRVIGANGSLTGYGGGMERKRFLLQLEAATAPGSLFD